MSRLLLWLQYEVLIIGVRSGVTVNGQFPGPVITGNVVCVCSVLIVDAYSSMTGRHIRDHRRQRSEGRTPPHRHYDGEPGWYFHVQRHADTFLSKHWHGLFQTDNNQMDGVDTVTQCPISPTPGSNAFTYKFNTGSQGETSSVRKSIRSKLTFFTHSAGTYWYHS